jgi:hypothetical protein
MSKKKQIKDLNRLVVGLQTQVTSLTDILLKTPEEQAAWRDKTLVMRKVVARIQGDMEKTMLASDAALREDIAKVTGPWPEGHRTTVRTGMRPPVTALFGAGFPGRTWNTLHKPGPGDNIEIPPIPAEVQADRDNVDFVRERLARGPAGDPPPTGDFGQPLPEGFPASAAARGWGHVGSTEVQQRAEDREKERIERLKDLHQEKPFDGIRGSGQ